MGRSSASGPEGSGQDGRSRRAALKRAERRDRVLETALSVFSEKGYHQTRISDIIEAAGIARGTFYLYFDNKSAIFHELLDRLISQIQQSVRGVDSTPGAPPVGQQVRSTVRRVLEVFHRHPSLTTVVLRVAVGVDAEVDAKLEVFYGRLHSWLCGALDNGQRMGLLRTLNTPHIAWCILGSVKELVHLSLDRQRSTFDVDAMSTSIVDFSLVGILREPSVSSP